MEHSHGPVKFLIIGWLVTLLAAIITVVLPMLLDAGSGSNEFPESRSIAPSTVTEAVIDAGNTVTPAISGPPHPTATLAPTATSMSIARSPPSPVAPSATTISSQAESGSSSRRLVEHKAIAKGTTVVFFQANLLISLVDVSAGAVTAVIGSPGRGTEEMTEALGETFTYSGLISFEIFVAGVGEDQAEFSVSRLGSDPLTGLPRSQAAQVDLGTTVSLLEGDLRIGLVDVSEGMVTLRVSSPGHETVTVEDKGLGYRLVYNGTERYDIHVFQVGDDWAVLAAWLLE